MKPDCPVCARPNPEPHCPGKDWCPWWRCTDKLCGAVYDSKAQHYFRNAVA
jgi:hypothetical protein